MKINKLFIIGFAMFMLAGCAKTQVAVNLSSDEIKNIQNEISTLQKQIDDFKPTQSAAIPWQAIIDMARDYEKLGKLDKAIEVYEDVVKGGKPSKSILNNLGRLYEKADEYDKAVAIYQRIVETYMDRAYLYDITWAYIRKGDVKNAEKYFNGWQLEFKKTDQQTQDAIKDLKASLATAK